MAVNKARTIASILGTNSLVSYDSDLIETSYNKGPASSSTGTMSVYSSIDSLPGSAEAGTKALITSTNTLYIYNNGWYKIAIINNFNPQWITQPDGSYILAIDGSTTTITVVATDSDDVPITYSAVTDSGFDAFATIAHDSDKDNIWTVTPTGTSGSYSGSVTFKASDGVNLVQAVSSFTLSFSVEGSAYSRFYLLADSDGEASATDETGTVTTGPGGSGYYLYADSPYRPNDYSVESPGSGTDYFVIDSPTTDLSFGTDTDFCIEMWIYPFDASGIFILADMRPDETNGAYLGTLAISSNELSWYHNGTEQGVTTGSVIKSNEWNHLVFNRISDDISMYVNGTREHTTSTEYNFLVGKFRIFKNAFSGGGVSDGSGCRIRDYKVTKGRGIYSGTSYTVPTSAAVEDSDTSLLLWNGGAQTPTHLDRTGKQTLTVTGYFKSVLSAPFDQPKYHVNEHGASARFFENGSLGFTNDSLFRFGSNSGTIACWVKQIDEGYSNGVTNTGAIFGNFSTSATSHFMNEYFYVNKTTLAFSTNRTDGNATYTTINAQNTINPGVWNWVVFVKDGDYWSLYSNGNLVAGPENKGNTTSLSTSHAMLGGNWSSNTVWRSALDGYVSDFTVINRAMDSDWATSVPTSPQTADSDAVVLTLRKPSTLVDTYSYGHWSMIGNASLSTAQQKITDIKSIYFDGNNDYLNASSYDRMNIGTEDFCIEHWTYVIDLSVHRWLTRVGSWNTGNNRGFRVRILTDGSIRISASNGAWNSYPVLRTSSVGLISTNTWHHIAMCRHQGEMRLFVDGIEDSDYTFNHTTSLDLIGQSSGARNDYAHFGVYYADNTLQSGSFYGYIQDYRFSRGGSPYTTANFTPPTEPLKG